MPSRVLVGFSTSPRNPLAWLIRKVTGSKVSHTFLVIEDEFFDGTMVMEADQWGVRMRPFRLFKQTNHLVFVAAPPVDLTSGLRRGGTWLGEEYDYTGLFGMAWVMLGRWLRKKWNNPWHAAHSLFCSELVVRIMKAARYPGAEDLVADAMSPQDVLAFLHQTGASIHE